MKILPTIAAGLKCSDPRIRPFHIRNVPLVTSVQNLFLMRQITLVRNGATSFLVGLQRFVGKT